MVTINKKPINNNIIDDFERENDIILDNYYKNFLLNENGGETYNKIFIFDHKNELNTDLEYLYGINRDSYFDLNYQKKLYKNRIPKNMLPVGEDCVTNLVLMSIDGSDIGKIYYWDHEKEANEGEEPNYSNITLVADSFEEFINNLKPEDELVD